MPKFIAVHPVAFNKDQLGQLAKERPPAGVSWGSTWCAFEEDKSYCEWDAPDKQTVEGIFAQYSIPYEAIYEVEHYNPQAGDFE
jgi:hypothetical protein